MQIIENDFVITNQVVENNENHSSEDEDEPPPLPPPRLDSLNRDHEIVNRPLPTIPVSTSLTDITYEDSDSIEEVKLRKYYFKFKKHFLI